MINKILALCTMLGMIVTGLLVYANMAYFPMASGAELEQKVMSLQSNTDQKLDRVITLLEKRSN